VVARDDDEAIYRQTSRLQEGREKLSIGQPILLRLATEGDIAAEHEEVEPGKIRAHLCSLFDVAKQGIAHSNPVELWSLLVPIREMQPGHPYSRLIHLTARLSRAVAIIRLLIRLLQAIRQRTVTQTPQQCRPYVRERHHVGNVNIATWRAESREK
jgi:hypothetical protein